MKCLANCTCKKHRKIDRPWTRGPRNRKQVNPESYDAVHHQIRKRRGRASEQACADCGNPATAWSFSHLIYPESAVQEIGGQRRIYSLNVEDYDPRCGKCHHQYDMRPETGQRISAALKGKPKPPGFAAKHPKGANGRFMRTS